MKKSLRVATLAGLAAMAEPAAAQQVKVTNVAFTPGYVAGTIHSPSLVGDTGVGRFEFKGTYVNGGGAFDLFTYCVDLAHYVSLGNVDYNSYSITPLSALSTITSAKAVSLNALLTNAAPLLSAATGQSAVNISAATQVAVWEIMFETQPAWSVTDAASSLYLTTPGGSQANTDAMASAQMLANSYLQNVASNSWTVNNNYQLKLLYSADQQSQIFLTGVPEPATWAMMMLGFGGIGFAMRRRPKLGARIRFA